MSKIWYDDNDAKQKAGNDKKEIGEKSTLASRLSLYLNVANRYDWESKASINTDGDNNINNK